jgi:hypothetical protein
MRAARFGLLLGLLSLAAACRCQEKVDPGQPLSVVEGPAPVPECRLDSTDAKLVEQVAMLGLQQLRGEGMLTAQQVAVNRTDAPGMLKVLVVKDGWMGMVGSGGCPTSTAPPEPGAEPDALSVSGVCTVYGATEIRCSSGAIHALLKADRDGVLGHPALLFVLAHEMAHIALGHIGHFTDGRLTLDLSASEQEKVSSLVRSCRMDDTLREQEGSADARAERVMQALMPQPPFVDPLLGPQVSAKVNAGRVFESARELGLWMQRLGQGVVGPDDMRVCRLMKPGTGTISIAIAGGSHENSLRRISRLTVAIHRVAEKLSLKSQVGDEHPAKDMGNALEVMGAVQDLDATVRATKALGVELFFENFCKDVYRYEAGMLKCDSEERPLPPDIAKMLEDAQRPPGPDTVDTPEVEYEPTPDPLAQVASIKGSTWGDVGARFDARQKQLIFSVRILDKYLELEEARRAEVTLRAQLQSFIQAAGRNARKEGGYWVYQRQTPVHCDSCEQGGGDLLGQYYVSGELDGILVTRGDLGLSALPSFRALSKAGSIDYIITPLGQKRHSPVLNFFPEDPKHVRAGKDVLTRLLTLEEVFDLQKAQAGQMNLPSPFLSDLITFIRARLERKYGERFSLREPGDKGAFFLSESGRLGEHFSENFDLPVEWEDIRGPGTHSAKAFRARLSHMADDGDHSRFLSNKAFDALFGESEP